MQIARLVLTVICASLQGARKIGLKEFEAAFPLLAEERGCRSAADFMRYSSTTAHCCTRMIPCQSPIISLQPLVGAFKLFVGDAMVIP